MISGIPAVGASSDIRTVASLPDAIRYFFHFFLGCFYDEAPLSAKEVDMHKIKNFGPVKGAPKHPSHHQRFSLLHYSNSSISLCILRQFHLFLLNQHVGNPEVQQNYDDS